VVIAIPPDNKIIYVEPAMFDLKTKHVRECDVNCVWTRNWNASGVKFSADAFISTSFPIPFRTKPQEKFCSHQKTLLSTAENIDKNEFEPKFDISILSRSDGMILLNF
jgi:hypothetical protein